MVVIALIGELISHGRIYGFDQGMRPETGEAGLLQVYQTLQRQ